MELRESEASSYTLRDTHADLRADVLWTCSTRSAGRLGRGVARRPARADGFTPSRRWTSCRRECDAGVRRQRSRRPVQRRRHDIRDRQPLLPRARQPVRGRRRSRPVHGHLPVARRRVFAPDRRVLAAHRYILSHVPREGRNGRSSSLPPRLAKLRFLKAAAGSAPTSRRCGSCGRPDATCGVP